MAKSLVSCFLTNGVVCLQTKMNAEFENAYFTFFRFKTRVLRFFRHSKKVKSR